MNPRPIFPPCNCSRSPFTSARLSTSLTPATAFIRWLMLGQPLDALAIRRQELLVVR